MVDRSKLKNMEKSNKGMKASIKGDYFFLILFMALKKKKREMSLLSIIFYFLKFDFAQLWVFALN